MSNEQKAGNKIDLNESSGGFMSVDRVDALVKNSTSIRGMTLPIVTPVRQSPRPQQPPENHRPEAVPPAQNNRSTGQG